MSIFDYIPQPIKQVMFKAPSFWKRVLPDTYDYYQFEGGKIYLKLKESWPMMAQISGNWEAQKLEFLREHVRPDTVFVDIGGAQGYFSLLAAHFAGDQGSVHIFEPHPTNADCIRKSIAANGYQSITVHEMALGAESGTIDLQVGQMSFFHSIKTTNPNNSSESVSVPLRRADDVFAEAGVSHIDIMKIDVEGAELDVLAGMPNTLAANPNLQLLIDIHPNIGVDPREVAEVLAQYGFQLYEAEPPFAKIDPIPANLKEALVKR